MPVTLMGALGFDSLMVADLATGLELALRLDAALHPPSPRLSNHLWRRLNQHWPVRISCAEPKVTARVAHNAVSFFEVRAARVQWLWRSLSPEDSPRTDDSHHGVQALDFSVVDKGGRS